MIWIGIGIAVGAAMFALAWYAAYKRAERMAGRVFSRLMDAESELGRKRQERKAEFAERHRSMDEWDRRFRKEQEARRPSWGGQQPPEPTQPIGPPPNQDSSIGGGKYE